MTPQTQSALTAAAQAGRAAALATRLGDGLQHVVEPAGAASTTLPPGLAEAARRVVETDVSAIVELAGEAWFVLARNPPLRLAVIGAVHVAQALAPLATALGFAVTVIDPRGAFATAARFPGVALDTAWPDEALAALRPDRRCAVVTLTHDPKLDDPALDGALRSEAFYIGALGSRRTHAGRLDRLAALGHDAAALARVRGPVGLPLGAVTAPEIALSIVAEIIAVRRRAAIAAGRG